MRYLVTGGTGFVGAFAVRDLVREGHEVTVFDLAPNRAFLADLMSPAEVDQIRLVSGDVTDLPSILRVMHDTRPDRIIHLAATLGASSEANALRALKVNCEGTINIFEAALTYDVPKVVWASSIAVFGPTNKRPAGEIANNAFHQPGDLYGACKSMNEQLARHYRRRRKLDSTGLRFSVVYGYGKALTATRGTGANFLDELIDKPALEQPASVPHGDELLDWLYVEDAARAVVLATKALGTRSIGLNICGERATVKDVAAVVRRLLPGARMEVLPGNWGGALHLETATTEAEIAYRPQITLEDGLRRNINTLRLKNGLAAIG